MGQGEVVNLPQRGSTTQQVSRTLRLLMTDQRITTQSVVNMLGGSYAYWNRRINGRTPLDLDDLSMLAAALGYEPGDFLPTSSAAGPNIEPPAGVEPATYRLIVGGSAPREATVLPFRRISRTTDQPDERAA